MRIEVVAPGELDPGLVSLWSAIQAGGDGLRNPFFAPGFAVAVGAACRDTFVGVIEDGNACIGFFPFQRMRDGVGGPVGGRLSDYQGAIVAEGSEWSAEGLIEGCRLREWRFDHLIAAQAPFRGYHSSRTTSPAMDLSDGFEGYVGQRLRRSSRRSLQRLETKRRKLEREHGPIRFSPHVADRSALYRVMRCKSEQYLRSGYDDLFRDGFAVEILERIFEARTAGFSGMLSTLCAGDHLVAAHFGMRSRTVLHYWFPCYARSFAAYSPGLLLVIELARAARSLGLEMIDFGRGADEYKRRLANTSTGIAEGTVLVS